MMKKTCFLLILIALLISLSGCTGIENALHEAGEKIQSNQVETPQNNGGDIDWSFVPVVREKAVSLRVFAGHAGFLDRRIRKRFGE